MVSLMKGVTNTTTVCGQTIGVAANRGLILSKIFLISSKETFSHMVDVPYSRLMNKDIIGYIPDDESKSGNLSPNEPIKPFEDVIEVHQLAISGDRRWIVGRSLVTNTIKSYPDNQGNRGSYTKYYPVFEVKIGVGISEDDNIVLLDGRHYPLLTRAEETKKLFSRRLEVLVHLLHIHTPESTRTYIHKILPCDGV